MLFILFLYFKKAYCISIFSSDANANQSEIDLALAIKLSLSGHDSPQTDTEILAGPTIPQSDLITSELNSFFDSERPCIVNPPISEPSKLDPTAPLCLDLDNLREVNKNKKPKVTSASIADTQDKTLQIPVEFYKYGEDVVDTNSFTKIASGTSSVDVPIDSQDIFISCSSKKHVVIEKSRNNIMDSTEATEVTEATEATEENEATKATEVTESIMKWGNGKRKSPSCNYKVVSKETECHLSSSEVLSSKDFMETDSNIVSPIPKETESVSNEFDNNPTMKLIEEGLLIHTGLLSGTMLLDKFAENKHVLPLDVDIRENNVLVRDNIAEPVYIISIIKYADWMYMFFKEVLRLHIKMMKDKEKLAKKYFKYVFSLLNFTEMEAASYKLKLQADFMILIYSNKAMVELHNILLAISGLSTDFDIHTLFILTPEEFLKYIKMEQTEEGYEDRIFVDTKEQVDSNIKMPDVISKDISCRKEIRSTVKTPAIESSPCLPTLLNLYAILLMRMNAYRAKE